MSLALQRYIYNKFSINLNSKGGRNRMGKITLAHRGSKCKLKRKFLNVDVQYSLINISYVLLHIRVAPRRTGHVGLILFKNGLFSYILVENTVTVGTVWVPKILFVLKKGYQYKLLLIPEGSLIYNVELKLGCGGKVARAAGTSIKIINKFPNRYNKILLRFRSGEEYFVNRNCCATLGVVSNKDYWLQNIGSAGKRRLFGFRSHVRGVAMNPVDHPHGGNTAGGKPCMTPTGRLTKGVKTRKYPISKKVIFKRRPRRIDCFVKTKSYKLSKKNENTL